jgi:ATP-dependent RNA helicase RhlE
MHTDQFSHLSLREPILRAISEEGYRTPTAIQEEAIPLALAGRDVLATAQTGTG